MTKSGFDNVQGLYWVWDTRYRKWTIAAFDGGDELCWSLIGTDNIFDWYELFEASEDGAPAAFALGPRATAPVLEQAA